MVNHIPTAALLTGVWAAFQLLIAVGIGLLFMVMGGGLGVLGAGAGEEEMMIFGAFYGVVGLGVAVFAGAMAVPGLVAAWGIYSRKSWARILGILVSALNCMSIPFGLMIGGFTIYVLLDRDVAAVFEGG